MKPATLLSTVLLVLIGALHLLRLASGAPVTVEGMEIPLWASVPAALVTLGLALGVWREHRAPTP